MKKAVLTVFLFIAAVSLCIGQPLQYKAGTYTGSAQGMGGEVKVEVSLSSSTITSIKVIAQKETPSIASPALERIPEDIVRYQSLAVDSVTGATTTSKAIINAVADAISKAGGNVAALKAVKVSKDKKISTNTEITADVVVIGAGGAGLAAAVEAKDKGAQKVVLLEKMASIGGTTFISQGLIGGYDSKLAKKLGVKLSYEAMYDNLMNNAMYRLDPVLAEITIRKSGETIDWLQDRVNVPFVNDIAVGYGPLKMMHMVEGGGTGFQKPFANLVKELNIDLMLETKATEILLDNKSNVRGVKALKDGIELTILAKAVVVATGGYSNNPILTVLLDPEKEGTMGIGFTGATGDGIIMANNAGAALTHMNHMMLVLKDYEIMTKHNGTSNTANVSRFIAAPNCILVGKNGKRFVDEKSGGYMTQELNAPVFNQMNKDKLGYVWAISDEAALKTLKVTRGLGMEFISAATPEALAVKMGLDPSALTKTIADYNEYVKAGFDKEFKRTQLATLSAPYVAVSVMPCEIITYGGVARNSKSEVLRADGSVMPGLYVAGEAGGNSAYMGFTLSNAFTWGRIAGSNAAGFAK